MQSSKLTTYTLRAIGTAAAVAALVACVGPNDEPDTIPPGSMPAEPAPPPPDPEPVPPEDPEPVPPPETMPPDDPDLQGGGAAGEVSDAQVNAFARAYLDVIEIQNRYANQISQEDPDADLEPLQAEAEAETEEAIESTGLSMQEFEVIGARADADPDLRERIQSAVRNVQ